MLTGWGDGNGDGNFVDTQTKMEFNNFHGVVVSSYLHDESERIPALWRDVPAARPTRATRDPNERPPHRPDQPFNPRPTVAR